VKPSGSSAQQREAIFSIPFIPVKPFFVCKKIINRDEGDEGDENATCEIVGTRGIQVAKELENLHWAGPSRFGCDSL
jgi:hypothetical protein